MAKTKIFFITRPGKRTDYRFAINGQKVEVIKFHDTWAHEITWTKDYKIEKARELARELKKQGATIKEHTTNK